MLLIMRLATFQFILVPMVIQYTFDGMGIWKQKQVTTDLCASFYVVTDRVTKCFRFRRICIDITYKVFRYIITGVISERLAR